MFYFVNRKGVEETSFRWLFYLKDMKTTEFSQKTTEIGKTEFPLEICISGIRRSFFFSSNLFFTTFKQVCKSTL
ncbi:MAG: hypothetical protein EGP82_01565 [Odoribacter splanchnicus]|nr:hypothetical protein [Odoribacter splanchnicus]